MDESRRRYLERRAIRGPWQIDGDRRCDYAGAIVIPACDEEEWIFRTLRSLAANPPELRERFLVLVVINHPPRADRRVREANRRTLDRMATLPLRQDLNLGWIDACSEGLEPTEGGVGFARKLGCDLALPRLDAGRDPLLVSLDADTLVEPGYLAAVCRHFVASRAGAAVIPFVHQPADSPAAQHAIDVYELYLRCYVLGLSLAGSPYAFQAIGSAFACRVAAYIRCGGMNRRAGGEDFYFLQAVAKTAGVDRLFGTTVRPSARLSRRVPFGTGPALARLLEHPDERSFFPLDAFDRLRHWLDLVAASTGRDGNELQARISALEPGAGQFLRRHKLAVVWDRLRQNHRGSGRLLPAFHGWFDGLKTLQLLKHLSRLEPPGLLDADAAGPSFLSRIGLDPTGSVAGDLALLRQRQNAPGGQAELMSFR